MEHRTNETPLLQTIGLQKYFKVRGNSLLHAVDGIDLTLYSRRWAWWVNPAAESPRWAARS